MAQNNQLFLQLSEAFGGTRFGPFLGNEVKLGSDPAPQCDITLPSAMGVFPLHVRLVVQGDGSIIVGPGERSAAITVWRGGAKGRSIASPVALSHGDSFALVSETGPKFTLLYIQAERQKVGAPRKRGPKMPTKKGLIAEIKRLGLAKAISSKVGQNLASGYHFVVSGAIFQPRYIIMGVTMAGSFLMAGGAGLFAFNLSDKLDSSESELSEIKGDLADCEGYKGESPTIASLVADILGDDEWRSTLENDDILMAEFKSKLGNKFKNSTNHKKIDKLGKSTSSNVPFNKVRRNLSKTKMKESLVTVLSYAAFGKGSGWQKISNTSGEDVCGRGPLGLTYGQAHNLGLREFQLDAYVSRKLVDGEDLEGKRNALLLTSERIDDDAADFDIDVVTSEPIGKQGGKQCLYIEGEDDRIEMKMLGKALNTALGNSADGVPKAGDDFWIAARLYKLYAADVKENFETLDFSTGDAPSSVLEAADISDAEKESITDSVAEAMAWAVATPCRMILEGNNKPPEHLGTLPGEISCIYIAYLASK